MYKMGQKLYETKCDQEKINKLHAHTMGEMKAMIKNSGACGDDLNDKELQAIMLYNWDVRLNKFEELHGENKEIKKHAEIFKKKFEKMKMNK